jgi:uncharacterized protein DUF4124
MKYFVIVLALIAALVAALMLVPVKNGQPLLDPSRVKSTIDEAGGVVVGRQDAWVDEHVDDVLYRWKDSRGSWQYGDRPPPGVAAEVVEKKSVKTVPADPALSLDGVDE